MTGKQPPDGLPGATGKGDLPISDGEPKAPPRSPLVQAVKLGSGKLVPITANATGMVVAMATPGSEQGGAAPGTLFTVDDVAPLDVGLKNALESPVRSLAFATHHGDGPLCAGTIPHGVDLILAQVQFQIQVANALLDCMVEDGPSLNERVHTRELLEHLSCWVNLVMIKRSGGDASDPLDLPQHVAEWAVALSSRGTRIRHFWREAALAGRIKGVSPPGVAPRGPTEIAPTPLTDRERLLLEALSDLAPGEGMTGKQILQEFVRKGLHGVDQKALTTRLITPMRKKWGWELPNERRGSGYYLSVEDRERFARLDRRKVQ